jgi:hypothetical protein
MRARLPRSLSGHDVRTEILEEEGMKKIGFLSFTHYGVTSVDSCFPGGGGQA